MPNTNHLRHATAVLIFLLSLPATAQWLNYPTPGVPRTPDGKPNLTAPAPRTADGHPDLSGIWDIEHNRPCPPQGCNDMLIGQEFVDIGWSLPHEPGKDGLPFQPWAAKLRADRIAANGQGDPSSHCTPVGLVKLYTSPLFRKFVYTPGLILMLSEFDGSRRQIFTDGRPLPENPQPTFNGYSTAKWDGDTLVVRTAGFPDGTWLDRSGTPMTEAATITERIRRPDFGHLQIDLTIDDPKSYTKPWTIRLNEHIVLDTELIDYYCAENERDVQHLR